MATPRKGPTLPFGFGFSGESAARACISSGFSVARAELRVAAAGAAVRGVSEPHPQEKICTMQVQHHRTSMARQARQASK